MQNLDLNLYQNLVTTDTFYAKVAKNPIDCLINYGMGEATLAYIKTPGFAGLPDSVAKKAILNLAENRAMESLAKFEVASIGKLNTEPKPAPLSTSFAAITLPSVTTSAPFVPSARAEPRSAAQTEVTSVTRTLPSAPIFTQAGAEQWPGASRRVKFEDESNWARFGSQKSESNTFDDFSETKPQPNNSNFQAQKPEPYFQTFSATERPEIPKVEINNLSREPSKPYGKIKLHAYDQSKDLGLWLENSYVLLQYLGVKSIDRIIGTILPELGESTMSRAIQELAQRPKIETFKEFKEILVKALSVSESEKERQIEKLTFTSQKF